MGWGTAEEILDPAYAAHRFYEALLAMAGWEQMTITQAAQAVQLSAHPDAYAPGEPLARALRAGLI